MNERNSRSAIIERAAEYHVRIAAGEMAPGDWQELESWINQDSEHRRVLESMGDLSQSLGPLGRAAGEQEVPDCLSGLMPILEDARGVADAFEARRPRWQSWPVALAAGLVAAVALSMFFMAANQQPPSLEYVSYETAVAERRNVALDDGSTVMLNADTRLLAAFSDSERRLSLRHGEIFVDVVPDASRPFHVEVGGHIVTVTGTAFNVRFRNEPARVTVDEGSVGVIETKAGAIPMQLEAGQQLILEPDATPVTLSPSDLRNSSTWRDGWLHFDDQSLDVVVRELNLYADTRIILGSRQASELRVTGSFNVDNTNALLAALESVLPVTVSERNQHIVIDYDAP